ncbi:hypothetical protein EGW08_014388 [Elysia chlorotica]|uniref:ShKT domain-containing protein n=1 Tax=Elysia chlorotica TaxID=188477 RepID=A0A433T8I4_ELYCH|nr:hypothetical protein EGW08_014388 [Elysia chlorotica]
MAMSDQFPKTHPRPNLLTLLMTFSAIADLLSHCVVMCCEFPPYMRMGDTDPPWISQVRAGPATATSGGGSVGVLPHDSEYFIRQNIMEVHYPGAPQRAHVRWQCSMAYHGKLLLRRQDHHVNNFYRCVKLHARSPSLVQIAWSREATEFDLDLCEDEALTLDPWLLVRAESVHEDHADCPFSGGFDMKLSDSRLGDNSCNLMLRPMRLEAECVGGEGVTFDYVQSNCLPDLRTYVHQRTLCVSGWRDRDNHYVVLRRKEDSDLWCLVMPVSRDADSVTTAYLYSDLACMQRPPSAQAGFSSSSPSLSHGDTPRYFTLMLRTRVYPSLCEDEYSACSKVSCNAYVERECQRSCGVCDPQNSFTSCEYPRRLHGRWQLNDINGVRRLDISGSNFSLAKVGNFRCVTYPDGPEKKSRVFTTVSLSDNGCRPRYTCLKIKRLGPAALSFSLSHSFAWPELQENFGAKICSENRFFPDPPPIDDLYRSYQGSGKAVVSVSPQAQAVSCNISAVMSLTATQPGGRVCTGRMFRHCEDATKVRLELHSCGEGAPNANATAGAFTDYQCMANYEGQYWERIVLVQNVQETQDVRCFVFSKFYPEQAFSLLAGQCDKAAFEFSQSGLRTPLLKLDFLREEAGNTCASVPAQTTTLTPAVSTRRATSRPQRLVNSQATMDDQGRQAKGGGGDRVRPKHTYNEPGDSPGHNSISVASGGKKEVPTVVSLQRNSLRQTASAFCALFLSAVTAILHTPLT